MPRLFAWLIAAGALFGQTIPPEWECLPPPQERRAARWVTPEEAKELEASILKNPADADSRDVLVKHYERSNDRERLRTHALWLVENRPVQGVSVSASFALLRVGAEETARLQSIWERHIGENPDNFFVLMNAAEVFRFVSYVRLEQLLRRAQTIQPDSPVPIGYLASSYGIAITASEGIKAEWVPADSVEVGRRIKPELLTSRDVCLAGMTGGTLTFMLTDARMPASSKALPELRIYAERLLERGKGCREYGGIAKRDLRRLKRYKPATPQPGP